MLICKNLGERYKEFVVLLLQFFCKAEIMCQNKKLQKDS